MAKQQKSSDLQSQSLGIPVVIVLGHVDHGKTSLLDTIRKTNIAQREHGGITQKIGASAVEIKYEGTVRTITFIDTPGHEAFSAMRSRGAEAADIGLLVVSSVDGVMPQTRESIRHLKASKIPFIVVLTKADLPDKNIEKIKQQLEHEEILMEGRGGDTPVIEVSARTEQNIKELLELIILAYDLHYPHMYKEQLKKPFSGIVIESKLDAKVGSLATVVVKTGSISLRDELLCDETFARVRNLLNGNGEKVKTAKVGEGIEITGFEKVPPVGALVYKKSEAQMSTRVLEQVLEKGEYQPNAQEHELSVILCADTQGSLEAIKASFPEAVHIVAEKTSDVSEADVSLAKSTGSIVLGFNIKIRNEIAHLAHVEKILVKNYTIIYELLDEVKDVLEGKQIALEEKIYGAAKILATFPFEKTQVLGIRVLEGRIARGDKIRILRGEQIVGESSIVSVRQGKEVVSKIEQNKEGGILISPFLDITIGDMIICHS